MTPRRHAAAALTLALAALPCQAGTALERQAEADAKTAPHQRLGPVAKPVLVHYVQLKDDFQASPIVQGGVRQLRELLPICVEGNRRLGRPVNPPPALPDQVLHTYRYDYAAPNRTIIYTLNYRATMADDCSLLERIELNAKLHSSKGTCVIDLQRKTAKGVCDASGHADAPVKPPPGDAASLQAALAPLAADPRMAKQIAALRQLPGAGKPVEGARRTIAGVECRMIEPLAGARGCISRAGSFVPTANAARGMSLYVDVAKEVLVATQARFDLPLDPAIFTPYLNGGYTISGKDAQ